MLKGREGREGGEGELPLAGALHGRHASSGSALTGRLCRSHPPALSPDPCLRSGSLWSRHLWVRPLWVPAPPLVVRTQPGGGGRNPDPRPPRPTATPRYVPQRPGRDGARKFGPGPGRASLHAGVDGPGCGFDDSDPVTVTPPKARDR